MSVATEIWASWGFIALEELSAAQAARRKLSVAARAGQPLDLNEELYPAMQSIVAAVTSIDGFATVVSASGVAPRTPRVKHPTRAHFVWEILRAGFVVGNKTNVWPRQLKDLYILRSDRASGGLLHPQTIFGLPTQHPLMPNVAPARALYTVETAERAVDLMKDIYGTCKSSVRPWAGNP